MPKRWVGIDEAGYGPNLGPLVMTAVVVSSDHDRPIDLWNDLGATVARAGGDADKLWVDDSKAIYKAGSGRDRLETTCLAAAAELSEGVAPTTLGALLAAFDAGDLDAVELLPWLDAGDPVLPVRIPPHPRPFLGASWRIETIRSVVVGPTRFNQGLERHASKAKVHFESFTSLLLDVWKGSAEGQVTHVRGDKHGGRHFYYEPLLNIFPEAWIDRGPEGPELSSYTIRQAERRLELSLAPRADAVDGLVALASVVSKAIREYWMDAFNGHWAARIPGLKPTAGYPMDARRFRSEIEPHCQQRGLEPSFYWRLK